jgi:predicted Zn-dependent protease
VVNNRAALLLITGENPAEALRLTFEGLRRQPDSLALQVNHAMALQRNGRTAEAARLLERIPADRLSPDLAASYHLATAEVRAAEGRREDAAAAAGRVERSRLLPPQLARLDRVLAAR